MIPIHPLADEMPQIEGEEYAELVASIKAIGKILEPVTLYEGKILDGRNRYRACLDAGIEPSTVEFDGSDPIAFVLAKNLHRRHLNASQRAMIMAKYATFQPGDAQSQMSDGHQCLSLNLTKTEAARLAAVSARTICDAKLVMTEGTLKEIASVKNGEANVKPMAGKIRARKKKRNGIQIRVPDGYSSIIDAVRTAIELERAGAPAYEVIKQIKMSANAYKVGRDVVLLADRNDLSKNDSASVQAALLSLEKTRQTQVCADLIKPIAQKIWGHKGHRFKDKNRSESFVNSVSFVLTTCNAATEMEVPHLDKTKWDEVLESVSEAIASLQQLHKRLKRESAA